MFSTRPPLVLSWFHWIISCSASDIRWMGWSIWRAEGRWLWSVPPPAPAPGSLLTVLWLYNSNHLCCSNIKRAAVSRLKYFYSHIAGGGWGTLCTPARLAFAGIARFPVWAWLQGHGFYIKGSRSKVGSRFELPKELLTTALTHIPQHYPAMRKNMTQAKYITTSERPS